MEGKKAATSEANYLSFCLNLFSQERIEWNLSKALLSYGNYVPCSTCFTCQVIFTSFIFFILYTLIPPCKNRFTRIFLKNSLFLCSSNVPTGNIYSEILCSVWVRCWWQIKYMSVGVWEDSNTANHRKLCYLAAKMRFISGVKGTFFFFLKKKSSTE